MSQIKRKFDLLNIVISKNIFLIQQWITTYVVIQFARKQESTNA